MPQGAPGIPTELPTWGSWAGAGPGLGLGLELGLGAGLGWGWVSLVPLGPQPLPRPWSESFNHGTGQRVSLGFPMFFLAPVGVHGRLCAYLGSPGFPVDWVMLPL